jgi:hypothetical protein
VMAESAEREKEEAKPRVSYAGKRSAMGKNVAKPRRPLRLRRQRRRRLPTATAPLVFTHLWRNARAVDAENAAFPSHALSASLCVNCHAPVPRAGIFVPLRPVPPSSPAQKCPEELVSVGVLVPRSRGGVSLLKHPRATESVQQTTPARLSSGPSTRATHTRAHSPQGSRATVTWLRRVASPPAEPGCPGPPGVPPHTCPRETPRPQKDRCAR